MWKTNRNKTSDTPRYCLQLQHTHCKVGTKQIFLSLPWLLRLARLIPSLSFCPRLFLLWEAEIERLKLRGARETLCIVVAGIRGACVCTAALTCYIIWIDFRERGMKKRGILFTELNISTTGHSWFQEDTSSWLLWFLHFSCTTISLKVAVLNEMSNLLNC